VAVAEWEEGEEAVVEEWVVVAVRVAAAVRVVEDRDRRKGSDANAYWEWGSFTIRRIARIALTC
jgi:hypothetical protein